MKFEIKKLDVTASTNDDVKKAAESGAAEGLVVWAKQQTAGRGREGRTWHSPEGNLYFSVLLRPTQPVRLWGCYSFAASLAIADVVKELPRHADIELKWPNDVLVNGKKISGILLEAGPGWLVAGIGLNVFQAPDAPLYPATSLAAEKGMPPPLERMLNKVLEAFAFWYGRMNASGFAPIREAWLLRARKGDMRVRLPNADEINGTFADLDADGNLHLRLADGTERLVNAGDVFFRNS